MSLLDKMRAKQPGGSTQVAPSHKPAKIIPIPRQSLPDAPGSTPAPKADSKPKKPKKEAPVAFEEVKASCGHPVKIKFTGEEDPKTVSRRKHYTSLPCEACAAPFRAANKAKREAIAKCFVDARKSTQRLPDGAHFDLKFHAPTKTWSGTLSFPDGRVFHGQMSAVFRLLQGLDLQYREDEAKRVKDDQATA